MFPDKLQIPLWVRCTLTSAVNTYIHMVAIRKATFLLIFIFLVDVYIMCYVEFKLKHLHEAKLLSYITLFGNQSENSLACWHQCFVLFFFSSFNAGSRKAGRSYTTASSMPSTNSGRPYSPFSSSFTHGKCRHHAIVWGLT